MKQIIKSFCILTSLTVCACSQASDGSGRYSLKQSISDSIGIDLPQGTIQSPSLGPVIYITIGGGQIPVQTHEGVRWIVNSQAQQFVMTW